MILHDKVFLKHAEFSKSFELNDLISDTTLLFKLKKKIFDFLFDFNFVQLKIKRKEKHWVELIFIFLHKYYLSH